jgi:hypothetical protein
MTVRVGIDNVYTSITTGFIAALINEGNIKLPPSSRAAWVSSAPFLPHKFLADPLGCF